MPTLQTISATDLKTMQQRGGDLLLVNTLAPEYFEKTNIPGAVNIPQDNEDFVKQVEQRAGSKDKTIVVYCANQQCTSSSKAAEKLMAAGFTNVLDFEGGAEEWNS